jgi:hypothetical protein
MDIDVPWPAVSLKQGSTNYSHLVKSSPSWAFVNKVLLEHSHMICSVIICLLLLLQ